jgi:dolichol kinase
MMIIGVGDTMAAFIGRLYGQQSIHCGSGKTLEGTAAGAGFTLLAWWGILWWLGVPWGGGGWLWWGQFLGATVGASLLEACTSQLDNIMIPLWYLPHLILTAIGSSCNVSGLRL